MRYWVTPFPLSAEVWSTFNAAGLRPWPLEEAGIPAADALLLYDSPDQLIAMAPLGAELEPWTARGLARGYQRLLAWSEETGLPLLAISRLRGLGPKGLGDWLAATESGAAPPVPSPEAPPPISPSLAALTLSLIEAEPGLLDHYHDLELRATLLGREPDLHYQERLRQSGQDADELLRAYLSQRQLQATAKERDQRLAGRERELGEMKEALRRAVLAEGEKQLEVEGHRRDLEDLRQAHAAQRSAQAQDLGALSQRFELRVQELEQCLARRDRELAEARRSGEQTLTQLRLAQESLDRSVLEDCERQVVLERLRGELEDLNRDQAALRIAHQTELEALRQGYEPRLEELEQRLATREAELLEARQAGEDSLRRLHQTQKDLELYFLADGQKQRELAACLEDLQALRQSQEERQNTHQREVAALRQRFEPRLVELEQCLSGRETELLEAREAAEVTLSHLHQVQEELERYFLADAEKQRQLEAAVRDLETLRQAQEARQSTHQTELEGLRQRYETELAGLRQGHENELGALRQEHENELGGLRQEHENELGDLRQEHDNELGALRKKIEPRLAELEQHLEVRDGELREAREAAELTLLQLHQVQEELEHYFLKARASEQLAQAQMEQLRRAQGLLARLHPDLPPSAPETPVLAVEVLAEVTTVAPVPSLQTEALLSTYAASLQRASALLERSRRS